ADASAPALLKDIDAGKKIKVRRTRPRRRLKPAWLAMGTAALTILAGIIAYNIFHPQPSPPPPNRETPITLAATPPSLHFIWDAGAPNPAPQYIVVRPAGLQLQPSVHDDWLTVRDTGQADKLEIRVNPKDLHVGAGVYVAQVVMRAPGRPVTNDPLFI